MTALYAGPALSLAWGGALATEIALDVPLVQRNSGTQSVPDYRLHLASSWRF
jgi:hypothetical protein